MFIASLEFTLSSLAGLRLGLPLIPRLSSILATQGAAAAVRISHLVRNRKDNAEMWGIFNTAHQQKLAEAEHALVSPYVQRPYRAHKVEIEPNVFVHTLSFDHEDSQETSQPTTKKDESAAQHMVLTHGYAAGIGFWYRNFNALANIPNVRLHAIDWLGNGQSSRVPMPKDAEKAEEVENMFVESLEKWREQMKLDRIVLVGHSLGGFLSACYALKYPERVEHLVLVSPVGLPERPQEFDEGLEKRLAGQPAWQRGLYQMVRRGWDNNVTPQSVLRGLGPFDLSPSAAGSSWTFAALSICASG